MSMGNGSGKSEKLLERIANTLDDQTQILLRHANEIGALRVEMGALRVEMGAGFAETNGRLDGLIESIGGHHRDLERRVTAIEEHLGLKKT